MISAVDHINIVVSDLERSVKFYTELLGFREIRRARLEGKWIESVVGLQDVKADVVFIAASAGEPRLELLCYISPHGKVFSENSTANTTGLRHIALRVDDIHSSAKRLKEAGVTMVSKPVTVPSNVVSHDSGNKILCYFLDPDGTLLELAEYR